MTARTAFAADSLAAGSATGPATRRQSVGSRARAHRASSRLHWSVVLLVIGLVIPVIISVGPLRLSPYRLVLLATIVPCLVMWLSGKAGSIRGADIAVLLMCVWIAISLTVIHGPGISIEGGGIAFVEAMGGYLLGRCMIRNAESFKKFVGLYFTVVVFFLPFALIEAITGRNVINEAVDIAFTTFPDIFKTPRLGMRRVQSAFEHPILFGVFTGSALALTYKVLGYGRPLGRKIYKTALVAATSFLSLSSGPAIALGVQTLVILWDGVLRKVKSRWTILIVGAVTLGTIAEVLSNRTLPEILIENLAFDTNTGWTRVLIWQFGTASVADHPWFGVGLNEWERLPWMTTSIDMFWLAAAMMYGLPAAIFLHLSFLLVFVPVSLKRGLSPRLKEYRIGFLIVLISMYFCGWAVHYWNATFVLYFFVLGSGMWLLDAGQRKAANRDPAEAPVRNRQ